MLEQDNVKVITIYVGEAQVQVMVRAGSSDTEVGRVIRRAAARWADKVARDVEKQAHAAVPGYVKGVVESMNLEPTHMRHEDAPTSTTLTNGGFGEWERGAGQMKPADRSDPWPQAQRQIHAAIGEC